MKYDDISIGDCAEILHIITKNDIDKFVDLTGDDNKIHVDKSFAAKTSFKKPVVHGMLGASFISTIIGTKLPGDGALWYAQELEFLQPVRIGDELKVVAEVIKKNNRMQSIELSTLIYNQNKQVVTKGVAKVKVVSTEDSVKYNADHNKGKPRNVLVIGATGGIGEAACIQLAMDGYNLAIHCYKNIEKADSIKKRVDEFGIRSCVVAGNITHVNDVEAIRDHTKRKLGIIDVIINCSTVSIQNIKFSDVAWDDFQRQYMININGTFNLIKAFLPEMEKQNFGKYIGISTVYTDSPISEMTPYITSKTALNGLIKSLAVEFAPKGIRLNLVSPGMVDTDLIADVPEKARLLEAAQTPLRCLAQPEDITGTVSFLVSEKSNFLTGETIRVNGGKYMI